MTVNLGDIRNDAMYHLGDVEGAIWTSGEIDSYIKQGYDELMLKTEVLWETAYLEDEAGVATATVPTDLYRVDRASWSYKRIDPVSSSQLEDIDSRYQLTTGEVIGYLQDKDGLRTFRKYRVPAQDGDEFTVNGSWGAARSVSDVSNETVTGTWGAPRQISGQHPISGESLLANKFWGLPRRFYKDLRNTRIEYARRGQSLSQSEAQVELPDRYGKYLRLCAMWKALDRPGKGQDVKLAEHFKQRWDISMARVNSRKNAVSANRERQMGGGGRVLGRPPRPRWPWNYGNPRGY